MNSELTADEIDLLIESLRYTKESFNSYEGYPPNEFKQDRLNFVDSVRDKL